MKILIVLIFIIGLTGCADTVPFTLTNSIQPVGFWYGLWHGGILPISWFVSLFNDSTAIYAIYNNDGWYNFGFILGTGALSTVITFK